MLRIDLNCDIGEGIPGEDLLMPYISSANISCGSHAGDEDIIRRSIDEALKYGVAIGAHPSYPDRENFGRIDMVENGLDLSDLLNSLIDQLYLFQKIARESGAALHHIKPHGALYNRAAKDPMVSAVICQAITETGSPNLLYGLSESVTGRVAGGFNIGFCHEVFADRTYQNDGSLTSRTQLNALITDSQQAGDQVLHMLKTGGVRSVNGNDIQLRSDTICIHGDGAHALAFVKHIHQMLKTNGYSINAV